MAKKVSGRERANASQRRPGFSQLYPQRAARLFQSSRRVTAPDIDTRGSVAIVGAERSRVATASGPRESSIDVRRERESKILVVERAAGSRTPEIQSRDDVQNERPTDVNLVRA